jgi:DNA-binding response OmpR family regulator
MSQATRILLVEDDPSTAGLLTRWLLMSGYHVDVEHSMEEAMKRFRTGQYWDLVLADIELPGRSGLALTERLRRRWPFLPIMLISGHRDADVATAAISSGAIGFLMKPFTRSGLIERLGQIDEWQRQRKRILAIGAYMDDVEMGCGGTLRKYTNAGHQVLILPTLWGFNQTNQTRQESEQAASILGCQADTWHLLEPSAAKQDRATAVIRRVIHEFRPDIVFTHHSADYQQERRMIHDATLVAAEHVENVLCYQSHTATQEASPRLLVNIKDEFMEKLCAIGCYQSDNIGRAYREPDHIQRLAVNWKISDQPAQLEALHITRLQETLNESDPARTTPRLSAKAPPIAHVSAP